MYMNYFIQKEYGEDYYLHPDRDADLSLKRRSIDKVITDCFEQVVYSRNTISSAIRMSFPADSVSGSVSRAR